MKKLIVILTTLLITIFSLTACGNNSSSNPKGANTNEILKIGIDLKYPPFMYLDENNKPSGLEPDLAYALGDYLDMEVEIINTDFSMLIASLETGEIDIIISDMSITEDRKSKVDFSKGYRYGRTNALVNKDFYEKNNISDDMSAEDFFNLQDIKCIGLSGTVGTIIPNLYGIEATEASEIATAIFEVISGNSNVLIGSYVVFGDYAANPDTTKIYLGIPNYSTSAFAVKKGNTMLLNKANSFIDTLYEEGGLYEQLAKKYDNQIHKIYFSDKYGFDYITSKPE